MVQVTVICLTVDWHAFCRSNRPTTTILLSNQFSPLFNAYDLPDRWVYPSTQNLNRRVQCMCHKWCRWCKMWHKNPQEEDTSCKGSKFSSFCSNIRITSLKRKRHGWAQQWRVVSFTGKLENGIKITISGWHPLMAITFTLVIQWIQTLPLCDPKSVAI